MGGGLHFIGAEGVTSMQSEMPAQPRLTQNFNTEELRHGSQAIHPFAMALSVNPNPEHPFRVRGVPATSSFPVAISFEAANPKFCLAPRATTRPSSCPGARIRTSAL